MLLFSAAIANCLLMDFAAGCPPVMAVINKGESNFFPKTDVDKSISFLSISGKTL